MKKFRNILESARNNALVTVVMKFPKRRTINSVNSNKNAIDTERASSLFCEFKTKFRS